MGAHKTVSAMEVVVLHTTNPAAAGAANKSASESKVRLFNKFSLPARVIFAGR